MRWLRAPVVHFLVGGAVLFRIVHGATPFAAHAERVDPVVFAASDVARLRDDYQRETGLVPTADDEAALVEKAVEEELLFREALARGLDRNDRSVRNWLVEQMHVLAGDRTDDPERLYERARTLGLDQTDTVVRRILVQKMRLLAARTDERPPDDAELRAFYAQYADEYRAPGRIAFWHVFLPASAHGHAAATEASALLATYRRERREPGDAARDGEAFVVPPHVVGLSAPQIAKLFGPTFAAAVSREAAGAWVGPIPSAYGVHLVWIESREAGAPPPFEAVRGRVLERWQDARRTERVGTLLHELKGRYPLQVESRAWRNRSRS